MSVPWLKNYENLFKKEKSRMLLNCWWFYVRMDTDGDGLGDWTPIIDGKLSKILYPLDDDIDGDGLSNVFDPDPMRPDKSSRQEHEIPEHLTFKDAKANLQKTLFSRFGILAINHSDEHSLFVLQQLLHIFERALPPKLSISLQLRYLYAFLGHDTRHNLAGYYYQAKALSIGGVSSYTSESDFNAKNLQHTLAHEIGHAFLMSHVKAEDLAAIAFSHGGWNLPSQDFLMSGLFAPFFFKPFPEPTNTEMGDCKPTIYGRTNIHEWFADCFADFVISRLDSQNKKKPRSGTFQAWLEKRFRVFQN